MEDFIFSNYLHNQIIQKAIGKPVAFCLPGFLQEKAVFKNNDLLLRSDKENLFFKIGIICMSVLGKIDIQKQ